ncbi:ubiquitin-like protein 4A [Neodiprion pinetum]|uniref:Ubiquitin-like protein 4A n=1 Tax=Neodiprion lecontei TaxID=441921 RepID=A0A6J0BN11_NEOLC|nr:ubiquitin-like protein 4A [Neodiprion lecontei]XP_046421837.1 ubiquitin-like protein 4A [Neodiprion fabricii]XP_046478239.1 ubiquitin-like protein 4A [Neodiprion pinetum]
MKIVVKILQGRECVVDILPSNTVLELKHKVSESLGIAVPHQKLIHTGKALADDQLLSFYPTIKDGCKLNLFVKKQIQSEGKSAQGDTGIQLFRSEMSRVLRHYYTESETQSIINEFMKDLKKKVDGLSYDDLERLATALLQDQESTT